MPDKLLSTRHVRFVREFLKDGNATRAYIRAGYSRRGAQPSASRLLTQPHIAAAVAAGRQRLAQAVDVAVEGLMRIDPERADQARRAGIIALKVRNDNKQEKRVTLTLARPAPGLTAQDQRPDAERCAACAIALDHRKEEQRWLERQLDEARAALAEARATIEAAGLAAAAGSSDPAEAHQPMQTHSNRRKCRDARDSVRPRRS